MRLEFNQRPKKNHNDIPTERKERKRKDKKKKKKLLSHLPKSVTGKAREVYLSSLC